MDCFINGKKADVTEYEDDPLIQAVLISLFSWRRSNEDDGVEIPYRQGWWGDTFADSGDRIGSKLWLLRREKLTREVIARAKDYAEESLRWMVEDAVAKSVVVETERDGDRLNMSVVVIRASDLRSLEARFQDIWN
ncbi:MULTISPECIES: phage GP46 family protein [Bacteria]|uniref:phage GP46 family protein n=1 Tax=Bacteria TaxID=2 RepID=UPI00248CFB64|nr:MULTISPECIES: phage GP46 family protein [Bacteria]